MVEPMKPLVGTVLPLFSRSVVVLGYMLHESQAMRSLRVASLL